MTVRKNLNSEYPGSFSEASADVTYLKIESLDIYKNNTLKSSRVNMAVYADKNDLYQYEKVAPYTITIKPEIDNPIDIVPYYTDFYSASSINSAYVLPYNTTRLGQHTFAAGRIPVKTGMVYSEKYLNSYVYDTCLDVPKSTEMEIISNCNLPDWYLDVYHGYTTMSDAEKVRRVTEYVRDLHPYDENTDYPPNNVDFVPWFIKDAKSGICVHYAATSMILLRLLGVPARYVRGYVDQDSVPGTYSVILASQSHAWFEFFVPEYGWIMGDATPGYDSIAAYSNIEKVASEYPELEQTNFAKGDTHFFNPDNTTETSGSSEETATETSASASSDTSDTTASSDTTETTGSTDPSASDTKNTASPDQTSGNTGVPSGTSSSDKPADNSRAPDSGQCLQDDFYRSHGNSHICPSDLVLKAFICIRMAQQVQNRQARRKSRRILSLLQIDEQDLQIRPAEKSNRNSRKSCFCRKRNYCKRTGVTDRGMREKHVRNCKRIFPHEEYPL